MPISNKEKARILGLVEVERLQSDGMAAIEGQGDVNAIADRLLALSQQTSDHLVSEMAMIAHAGIASGQLIAASTALASVNDQIATATNAFALAARIAQEGQASLTFPFIAGKASSLLDFLKTLDKTVNDTITHVGAIDGVEGLITALEAAKDAVGDLKAKAEELVG